jgi:hypothetical protein
MRLRAATLAADVSQVLSYAELMTE